MQLVSRIWCGLAWAALVFSLCMQALVAFGIASGNSGFSIVPIVVASVLLLVSMILIVALPKGKLLPLLMAAAAGVLFIIVAVLIARQFTILVGVESLDGGITAWQFVYRHLSPLLVPLFLLGYWICWRTQYKIDAAYQKETAPDSYLNLGDFQLSRLEDEE